MTTAKGTAAGGGWFSKLVVVALLALAIALYLRIVMVDGGQGYSASVPQASVRVVESLPAKAGGAASLSDLPAEQMDLVRKVFAPELSN